MNSKATAFAMLAISLVACGKETQTPGDSQVLEVEQQFLDGVPANTPYVVTAIEPAPLAQILPWLQTLDDAAMPTPERIDELLADPELKPRKRRALALLAEMTGKYTVGGLEELGFAAEPRFVMYGIGVMPALRLEIEDSAKVGEFLTRFETRAGLTRENKRSGAHEYWTWPLQRRNRNIVVALQGNLLLAGVTPAEAEEAFVAQLFSDAAANSLDEATVGSLAADWGLQRYGVGYVDVARAVQFYLAPQPGLETEIWQTLRASKREVSDVCRAETVSIASSVPRVVFGSHSWAPSSLSFGGGLAVNSELTAQLAATKTGAPLVDSPIATGAAGIAGFAFDLGQVAQLVRTRAIAINDQPFQCDWFRGINKGANIIASRWSVLPPMVAAVTGGTLLVKDLQPATDVANVDAVTALATKQPVELFDFVKSFNNAVFPLSLDTSGQPVNLPAEGGLAKLQSPQVVAYPGALAMTSGQLAVTAADLAPRPTAFFFLRYDAEKIVEQLQLGEPEAPWKHALRGSAELELEPTARGLVFKSTYNRETAD